MKHAIAILFVLCCLIQSSTNAQFAQQGNKLVGAGSVGSPVNQGQSVSLSADGNTAIVGAPGDDGDKGAAWVYTRASGVWDSGTKLPLGLGAIGNAHQGWSVSLSSDGNTAIVGGALDNAGVGAVWVYTRISGTWSSGLKLPTGTGAVGNSEQGWSVSISADGSTALVGGPFDNSDITGYGPGAVWVYALAGGVWAQQGSKLVGTSVIGDAGIGWSVALSENGDIAIAGGPSDNNEIGAVWEFARSGGIWRAGTKLPTGPGVIGDIAWQGTSVSLSSDGNTAIVGGPFDDADPAQINNRAVGAVWAYTRTGGALGLATKLPIGTGGSPYPDQGGSVSVSSLGTTVIAGGSLNNGLGGVGTAWVYTLTGGVWTQQGTNLTGTGAVGNSGQGWSVSVSGDGSTAIVGGVDDNGLIGAAWVYALVGSPVVAAVNDIPGDQGGQVGVKWNKSPYDNSLSNPKVTSYSIWRALPGNQIPSSASGMGAAINNSDRKRIRHSIVNGVDLYWQWIADQPAHKLSNYGYAAPTLADSTSPTSRGMTKFFVSAQTEDPNIFYDSNPDSGYSVDNLAPVQPAGLMATVESGSEVKLTWSSPTDPDIGSYSIHRSTTSGFVSVPGNKIGSTISTSFTDPSPLTGEVAYYRIIAADVHGNLSVASAQVTAAVTITQQVGVLDRWNMISVPLIVSDFTKTDLYPTAVSNAFAYEGGYVSKPTLSNGIGYWLKFTGAQTASMNGLLFRIDTMDVVQGWNMIGSISQPVAVASVTSLPGGIVTSNFFGYTGNYTIADSIRAGKAYWVKVNQAGKLVLASSSSAIIPSARIRIVPTPELPPPAPDGKEAAAAIPTTFALSQNYPNPFNPTTSIKYDLPQQSEVVLEVYNTLGERIAILVDQQQEAGAHEASWNSSAFSSGVYFYRISAHNGVGSFTDFKKMVLIK